MGRKGGRNRGRQNNSEDNSEGSPAGPANNSRGGRSGGNGRYTNHHGFSTGAFGVMGCESDDFIQRSESTESQGEHSEAHKNYRDEQQYTGDSCTTSQLSINSNAGVGNNNHFNASENREIARGSRASSRSRMHTEDQDHGERDFHEYHQNSQATSQVNMRSSSGFENEGHLNIPGDQQSLTGSRTSSRSRMSLMSYGRSGECNQKEGELLRNSRAHSQLSIRSNADLEDGNNFNIPDERGSLQGSRATSRSRMVSESDIRCDEEHQSDRDEHGHLGDSRTMSQFSMRSYGGFTNGSELNIPMECGSYLGSRTSSRSRMLSENKPENQPEEHVHIDKDTNQFLHNRGTASQLSNLSNAGVEGGYSLSAHDNQTSYPESRASSRSLLFSKNGVQHNEDQYIHGEPQQYTNNSRAVSQLSMRSSGGFENGNELHIPSAKESYHGSRASSRSRMSSASDVQREEAYQDDGDPPKSLTNSRAPSRLSIRSNCGLYTEEELNANKDRINFRGSRSSSRSRMLSENECQSNETRQGNAYAQNSFGDRRATSHLSIHSNAGLEHGDQFRTNNDNQLFEASRSSSHSRMLSETDSQFSESRQSGIHAQTHLHNSRAPSHSSIRSNARSDSEGYINVPTDREVFLGSRASSRSRMLSETDGQVVDDRLSDNGHYLGNNRAFSQSNMRSNIGSDNNSHINIPTDRQSVTGSCTSSRSRMHSETAAQPFESQPCERDSRDNLEGNRAMSQLSIRSSRGFENSDHSKAREHRECFVRSRTGGCEDGNNSQDSFIGSRQSSRSELHSNRGYHDENIDSEARRFDESHASSHISVRSVSDDDEIMYAVLPKSNGQVGAIHRNRFISMTSNVSAGGYETDENLRLAKINSAKETHLNSDTNVYSSRLSMLGQSENPNASRFSMSNTHKDEQSAASNSFTNESRNSKQLPARSVSGSSTKLPSLECSNEVPVPLCTTNAMTPSSIRNRLISDHPESPSVFENTRIEAFSAHRQKVSSEMAVQTGDTIQLRQESVGSGDNKQRNVFNNSMEQRGHPAPVVSSGMLQQRNSPANVQAGRKRFPQDVLLHNVSKEFDQSPGSEVPMTPKSSRSGNNVTSGKASLNESWQSNRGNSRNYCESDASTTDRFSDVSYGSAYRWQVRESKMDKSKSGLADAKWEQKKRDPGRTVRNNVKPGMILKLASVFDQKQVLANRDVSLKGSIERRPTLDEMNSAYRHSVPANAFNYQGNSVPITYREPNHNRDGNMAYNGIQDAYCDVSEDTDGSDYNGFVNSTPVNGNVDDKYLMNEYNSHDEATDSRSSNKGNVKNMAAQFNRSDSIGSGDHVRRSSVVAPCSMNFSQDQGNIPIARGYEAQTVENQASTSVVTRDRSAPYVHMSSMPKQVENDDAFLRRSSMISRQSISEDFVDDNVNGHIDTLFGFVQDHDTRSNAVESVHRSFNRNDPTDRRCLARSVSKYREMQRTSVPNAGQLAQNRSDFKKATIDNRIVALATSTPRESPHGTTRDFNANYDDSFLSSITDGSRGPEKLGDYRHQMNKLNHALDMTGTQIAMTEKVLMQARKEKKPLQELAAQRTLLVSNQRMKLLHKELKKLQELANVRRLPPPLSKEVRGSMMISDIIVHLNPRFYNERNTDNNCSFAFVVLLKCGYEVEATSPVTIQSQGQFRLRQLHFFEKISFGNLPMSFEIQLEVYYMVIPGTKYDASCAANLANKCRNIFNPARKADRNADGLSVGEFARCGYLLLTRDTSSKTTFYLDSAEYPLESTIEVRSRCSELPPAIEVDFRGFLTMCQYVSGMGSWERYWAVLRRGCIYFWRYPDDESLQRDPRARLDLTSCIRETIVPCGPEQCPRPYSFSIDVLVSSTPSVMDRKRVLLSADSVDHMHSWLNAINETLNVIHC